MYACMHVCMHACRYVCMQCISHFLQIAIAQPLSTPKKLLVTVNTLLVASYQRGLALESRSSECLIYFLPRVQPCLTSSSWSLPRWNVFNATVVHALRRRLVATSPSTTWPDICHYHTRGGRLISNAVTKLVQAYRLNCMLHPEVEIQSSNQTKNWSKHWISTGCRRSAVGNQILNQRGSNKQNSNVSCCNVARSLKSNYNPRRKEDLR